MTLSDFVSAMPSDSFLEWFVYFTDYFQALDLIYQILILVGLVAVSVGALAIVYQAVKFSFKLVWLALKGTFEILRAMFFRFPMSMRSKYKKHPYPVSPAANVQVHIEQPMAVPVPPVAPVAPKAPRAPRPPLAPRAPRAPIAPVAPVAPVAPIAPSRPNTYNEPRTVKQAELLHCPMCGESFTNEMNGLLSKNNAVFCEFCGNKLEYVYE